MTSDQNVAREGEVVNVSDLPPGSIVHADGSITIDARGIMPAEVVERVPSAGAARQLVRLLGDIYSPGGSPPAGIVEAQRLLETRARVLARREAKQWRARMKGARAATPRTRSTSRAPRSPRPAAKPKPASRGDDCPPGPQEPPSSAPPSRRGAP